MRSTIIVLAALFCARPSPRSRLFVDCRVRRVQLGGHGGHDRDRRDHRHVVIVVSTTMRPSSRLLCHSHALFRRACAAFVARAALPTSIYRRRPLCRRGARRLSTCSAFVAPVSLPLLSKQRYDRLPPRRSASVASVALRCHWDHGRRANRRRRPSTRRYDRLAPRRLSGEHLAAHAACSRAAFFYRPRDRRDHARRDRRGRCLSRPAISAVSRS